MRLLPKWLFFDITAWRNVNSKVCQHDKIFFTQNLFSFLISTAYLQSDLSCMSLNKPATITTCKTFDYSLFKSVSQSVSHQIEPTQYQISCCDSFGHQATLHLPLCLFWLALFLT